LSTSAWSGTPVLPARRKYALRETRAKAEMVEHSFALTRKISPGWPSREQTRTVM